MTVDEAVTPLEPTGALTVRVSGRAVRVPSLLRLAEALPGLPGRTEYTLDPLDEVGVLFTLRSVPGGASDVRLFVVSPSATFPDYAPRLDAGTLGWEPDPERTALLVVAHPATQAGGPTANLLAPIVVDGRTGRATQVVLDGDWPLRAPLG